MNWKLANGDVIDLLRKSKGEKYRLVISSPPYNIGKSYENDVKRSLEYYIVWQKDIADLIVDMIEDNGSLCWQVGNYVRSGELIPLDSIFLDIFRARGLKLRNRIIWKFNFGLNADRRFSGRYETLLWFTKSENYIFNLNDVRVPQLYPGKRHAPRKGADKAGKPSGNPLGKNPSDVWEFSAQKDFIDNPVWDIPNVKANHPEKTSHPCQFPIELAERCVLAFTGEGDNILDPFVGTGASVIAAVKHGRKALGFDKDNLYLSIAEERIRLLLEGNLPIRRLGTPVRRPSQTEKVSRIPDEWQSFSLGDSVDAAPQV
ncbi:site-specific DNA-methyltransferase [Methylobacterium sp. Leaf125]|uniref:DNA-methyltransferase n=1 Tax=Methylobacterium sp. Leaf125 TaxID=1736265 RepID=UPI0009E7DBE1|nr:site-specific DNA-methyltransferase [Methylobacterium sp. Leaf125]